MNSIRPDCHHSNCLHHLGERPTRRERLVLVLVWRLVETVRAYSTAGRVSPYWACHRAYRNSAPVSAAQTDWQQRFRPDHPRHRLAAVDPNRPPDHSPLSEPHCPSSDRPMRLRLEHLDQALSVRALVAVRQKDSRVVRHQAVHPN